MRTSLKVRDYAKAHHRLRDRRHQRADRERPVDLSPEEAKEFLKELGVQESGVGALIRSTYHLLRLRTYFTAGEKEVRAWTIHAGDTAPKAAGVIHSDFERGFIKAERGLRRSGETRFRCRRAEKGLYRMEGKKYVVKDGDVLCSEIQCLVFEPAGDRGAGLGLTNL